MGVSRSGTYTHTSAELTFPPKKTPSFTSLQNGHLRMLTAVVMRGICFFSFLCLEMKKKP
jgi:hypothetical protein